MNLKTLEQLLNESTVMCGAQRTPLHQNTEEADSHMLLIYKVAIIQIL